MNFGINSSVRSQAEVPIVPDATKPFHKASLVAVKATTFKKKNEEEVPVLEFLFKDPTGRVLRHTEWYIEYGSKDDQVRFERSASRIKHIFEAFRKLNDDEVLGAIDIAAILGKATGIESDDENKKVFEAFYKKIAEDFAALGDISKSFVYILTVYDNQGNVGFPLLPNFIEPFKEGSQPRTLNVNPKYHTVVPPTITRKAAAAGGAGAAPSVDDLP